MDKYQVLEMIGEGSFGRVFKATCRATGDLVALKLIPKIGHSEREIRSLRSEFKIQKELSHPNIVRMIDAFETENELISVAEYIPGELYRLFDTYKLEMGYRRLPEERVKEIAGDLVSALHYLHSHRILHRDIKPQNILLNSEGRAKLCDFGFARNLGINTFVLTSIKGTPLYMAPELIEEKPYDHNADIWSLGCIIYELLVGQPPFSTSSLFQLIKKIRYESIQWPTHLSSEASSFLKGLLEKESKTRLSWPQLAYHPFIQEKVHLVVDPGSQTLTQPLSESQELAKEMQRQDKAKLLPGNSQTLIRVAQKHEMQKQQLAAIQKAQNFIPGLYRPPSKTYQRRFSDIGHAGGPGMLLGRHDPRLAHRRLSEAMLPTIAQAQYLYPAQPLQPKQLAPPHLFYQFNSHLYQQQYPHCTLPVGTAAAQLPAITASQLPVSTAADHLPAITATARLPISITGITAAASNQLPAITAVGQLPVSTAACQLAIRTGRGELTQFTSDLRKSRAEQLARPEPVKIKDDLEPARIPDDPEPEPQQLGVSHVTGTTVERATATSMDSNQTIKNEEIAAFENEEWCQFLDSQIAEVLRELDSGGSIDSMDNHNFLELIVGPLKSRGSNREVRCKVFQLLMLPFARLEPTHPSLTALVRALLACNIPAHLCASLSADRHIEEEEQEDDLGWAELALGLLLRLALLESAAMRRQLPLRILTSLLSRTADRPSIQLLLLSLLNVALAGEDVPDLPASGLPLEQLLNSGQPEVVSKVLVTVGLLAKHGLVKKLPSQLSSTLLTDAVTQQRLQFVALHLQM